MPEKSSEFSDLLAFMEQSTLKKVHHRNSVFRLCGDAFDSRDLLLVFGRAGKTGR